jgi:flagellar biosynthesis protein FlhG
VAAWKKYFGLSMDYLGCIEHDDEMWRTVRARRPLLLERPEAASARGVAAIGGRLLELDGRGGEQDEAPR